MRQLFRHAKQSAKKHPALAERGVLLIAVIFRVPDGRTAVGAAFAVLRVQKTRAAGGAFGVKFLLAEFLVFVEDECIAVPFDAGQVALAEAGVELVAHVLFGHGQLHGDLVYRM